MASSPPPEQQQQLDTPDKGLPAPAGWQKKITSLKSGGTPKRGAVYFIAPDGEEIKSKRSLEGYLKSHQGGPPVTEFDWSTGETPRRSSRLSSQVKSPLDTPESRKRPRRKVLVEDEVPQNETEPKDAPSAKGDEVMEDVEKVEESKTVENIESGEKIECKTVETIESVEKIEDSKTVEKIEESKTVESSIVPLLEENGPEELAKQEAASLDEQSKPEQMEIAKPAGEQVTDGEKNAPLEQEHKEQESSEKTSSGFPQFPDASNASRPVGISV